MSSQPVRVAVVIPCFRVSKQILGVLAGIGPEVERVYVVDDRCPEGTGDLVAARCGDPRVTVVRNDRQQGVGGATLAGYRRAVNILRDEEKKEGTSFKGDVESGLLAEPQEQSLATATTMAHESVAAAIAENDFVRALKELAELRVPVDAFFEKVLVNAPDAAVRANRLNLLARLRDCMHQVADFSKVEG